MKISYNWLKELIDVKMPAQELADTLTSSGIETSVASEGAGFTNVVSAKVLEKTVHPNADKLSVCKVTDGVQEYQVVCGAPNVDAGQIVALAREGAVLKGDFKIKKSKIRQIESSGMLCSESELGLKEESSGIMVLSDTTPLGKSLEEVLGPPDTIFDVEVTTNRGDVLSHLGVVREIGAKIKKMPKIPTVKTLDYDEFNGIKVENLDSCSRYIGAVIKGVKVASSPKWLTQRLEAIGVRTVNNIVDITNYVLFETGHPLHAFDFDKLEGNKISVRQALSGEKILALGGKEYTLDESMLVIADSARAQAIAGIMGSETSAVSDATVNILLESAVFAPGLVRHTARKLNLSSDSSYRFERGTSWEISEYASWRAANLIIELAGGRLEFRDDVNSPKNKKNIITFHTGLLKRVLGYDIEGDEVASILRFLGIDITPKGEDVLLAEIPSFRNDIKTEIDLVEEIARIYGYDKIPLKQTPFAAANLKEHSLDSVEIFSGRLKGLGFCEAVNYSFNEIAELEKFGLKYAHKIANPISKENEVLRVSLACGLYKNLVLNYSQGASDVKLFEHGKTYGSSGEKKAFALIASGSVWPEFWGWEGKKVKNTIDFYFGGGIVKNMLSANYSIVENKQPCPYFHPQKTAAVMYKGKVVGQFGIMHPGITTDLSAEVFYAEFDIETINA
ncbi:MAG: phenylalanine--tRNA ligase subunit beta, partial [Elusimicrobia bacterium]|nr:phenylalanine--tRNA ligase subunit beta [Elusimicrobiota bacterium]